ncbi:4Fe-4S binding protein [Hoylesella nanceiensis]|nr:4Fe-4S binding protein [Hoylesella nanceiensis]
MIKIDIRENCIKCGKCVAVCPVSVLSQDKKGQNNLCKKSY